MKFTSSRWRRKGTKPVSRMIIGIDLGTTNSLACVYRDKKTELIPNSLGEYLTPSVVSLDENGEIIIGGGTLDVSVVDCFDDVIEIVAVSGDNHLGGNDFDTKIAGFFCKSHDISMDSLSPEKRATLLRLAEKAKKELTRCGKACRRLLSGTAYCPYQELSFIQMQATDRAR